MFVFDRSIHNYTRRLRLVGRAVEGHREEGFGRGSCVTKVQILGKFENSREILEMKKN